MEIERKKELVAGLIIRDRRLLMVHNIKHGDVRIEPPGGKVEDGESYEEALVREVAEETGLKVDGVKLFGTYKTTSPEGSFDVHTYVCESKTGEPSIKEPEKFSGFGWYTYEELLGLGAQRRLVPNIVSALGRLKGVLMLIK